MKKKRLIPPCLLLWAACLAAQQPARNDSTVMTLEACQQLAQENYPLARRYDLIGQARNYDLANAGKGYLPQITLSGKATYQSETTGLPFDLPETGRISLPKDQYQVAVEVQQTLWDGGNIRSRKRLTEAASEVEMERQRADMYAVSERIDQLYFGILLLDEQLRQNALLQDDLQRTYRKIAAYKDNGIANQSDLDAVSVEQLNARQQRVELEASRNAYLLMLAAFVGRPLPPATILEKPAADAPGRWGQGVLPDNHRPELNWYDAQSRQLDMQESALKTGYMPRFGLFIQGAYGNPGLNLLNDDFSAWYMAGVRLSWNFGSLYTLKNDRRALENRRRQVATARDVFLFNTGLDATRQDSKVLALRRQMADDDEIIRLRGNIRRAAEAKVANGTLDVTDLLAEITRESLARCAKAQHEVQLLLTQYQLKHMLNQ